MRSLRQYDKVDWEDFFIGLGAAVTFIATISLFWMIFQS